MEKLYWSIGEVAEILGENVSLVRFWSDTFSKFVHPKRNAKGNRMYTKEDLEVFKKIHFLVRESGLKLEGVAKRLKNEDAAADKTVKILDSLKSMRAQLLDIRRNL